MSAAIDNTLISLADYERAAGQTLGVGAHRYLAGGAGDELTLRENLAAWGRLDSWFITAAPWARG
jgi:hypothetical protein